MSDCVSSMHVTRAVQKRLRPAVHNELQISKSFAVCSLNKNWNDIDYYTNWTVHVLATLAELFMYAGQNAVCLHLSVYLGIYLGVMQCGS